MTPLFDRIIHRALPLTLALAVLMALRVSETGVAGKGAESTTIAIGFMLMAAFVSGKIAKGVRLPRITGYLAIGLVVGPSVTGLVSRDMLIATKAVEGVAVALIAFTAGGELRVDWVRREAKRLTIITIAELCVVGIGVFVVAFAIRGLLPFMPADDTLKCGIIAMVFGAIAVADSPLVTIAVIAENQSEGPVTRTVLGVTILKDVCVIVLFAVALTFAKDALGEAGSDSLALTLLREIAGSVLAGLVVGVGTGLFLRYVKRDTPVFLLAVCFAIWQISAAFHLEALLMALAAGFWVENFSGAEGGPLIKAIEKLSLPVYALFFAAAGAKVDIGALRILWPFALVLAGTRAICVFAGTRLGTQIAQSGPMVKRYAWLGFISQAGVVLALSTIVARTFPTWGVQVQALLIAMIAIHEFVGPIGFQYALRRSGEVGLAAPAPDAALEPRQ